VVKKLEQQKALQMKKNSNSKRFSKAQNKEEVRDQSALYTIFLKQDQEIKLSAL
jgi:hypothetical protein